MKIKIDEVKFDKDLYPRFGLKNETVNRYRLVIDKLPPIVVTKRDKILVDGYHRLTAHKLEGFEEIEVELVDITDKKEIDLMACRLNSTSGEQLNIDEKKARAKRYYKEYGLTLEQIEKEMSVPTSTLSTWLSDIIQQEKNERNELIWNLWLNCRTQEEIADVLQLSDRHIRRVIKGQKSNIGKMSYIPEELQYFNNWKVFALRENQMKYPGVLPEGIFENVIYYYSEPLDIVVDPMAGSGVLGDVCKRMCRRYLLYDIKPIREDINIEENDILKGLPSRCNGATLVFLDPPYYNLMADDYVKNEFTESYDSFLEAMEVALKNCKKVLKQDGYISLKLKPMTLEMLEGDWLDMTVECMVIARKLKLKWVRRISSPLPTQQFSATDMTNAKNKKTMLNTVSDIVIFQK